MACRTLLTDLFHLATREVAPLTDRLLERVAAQPLAQADEMPLGHGCAVIWLTFRGWSDHKVRGNPITCEPTSLLV